MENKKPDKAEEPFVPYGKKRIGFPNSLEEMELDQLRYFAGLSPIELLANLNALIKSSFGMKKEPDITSLSKRINFNSEE